MVIQRRFQCAGVVSVHICVSTLLTSPVQWVNYHSLLVCHSRPFPGDMSPDRLDTRRLCKITADDVLIVCTGFAAGIVFVSEPTGH